MFSKSCTYGLRAVIYIANVSIDGRRVGLSEIAEAIDSPTAFTAKILQQLTKSKIVKSIKGPNGGFCIESENLETPLRDIVMVFEGDKYLEGCGLGLSACDDDHPCPLHNEFLEVRKKLSAFLENNTLASVINQNVDQILLKR